MRRFLEAQVAVGRGAAADGDHRGLRPRGVEADGQELGLQSLAHPRGVRRPGLHVRRARRSCSRRWAACCCARPYFSTRRARGRTRSSTPAPTRRRRSCCPGIASGETIADARVHRAERQVGRVGHHDGSHGLDGDSYTLDGTKMFVIDGHTADLIVVVGPTRGHERRGRHLVLHRRRRRRRAHPHRARDDGPDPQAGQARVRRRGGDAARRAGRRLAGAVARRSTRPRSVSPTRWSAARRTCSTCRSSTPRCACSSAGRSARSRRSSTSAPTCCSRSSRASRRRTTRRGPRPRTTTSCRWSPSLAKAYCSDAYFHAAAENIQIHGGIGFTWEHDAHLYFKRAKSSEILLGDATYHRELLAQRIGI